MILAWLCRFNKYILMIGDGHTSKHGPIELY